MAVKYYETVFYAMNGMGKELLPVAKDDKLRLLFKT